MTLFQTLILTSALALGLQAGAEGASSKVLLQTGQGLRLGGLGHLGPAVGLHLGPALGGRARLGGNRLLGLGCDWARGIPTPSREAGGRNVNPLLGVGGRGTLGGLLGRLGAGI